MNDDDHASQGALSGMFYALALDNARLGEELRRAQQERKRLVREMDEALRTRDDFLAMAAHDLKTPLTVLKLKLETIRRGEVRDAQDGLSPGRSIEKLAIAEQQVDRMVEMINELQDIARIGAGRISLHLENLDLCAVVRDVADRSWEELAQSGSTLCLSAAQPIPGRWDRVRLDQVVENLLGNAIKYGDGKPIRVCAEADGGVARLLVGDQRLAREAEELGSGLGVWIARRLVQVMGGAMQVRSDPQEGSTFTVVLPRNLPPDP